MRRVPSWLIETPIAHRGLHDASAGVPENSLAAFRAAAAKGYAIELDLQLSGDGEAVAFHDDELARLSGVSGAVSSRTAAELGRIQLLGTKETVPSLRQVLEEIAGQVPLLLELKTFDRAVGPLESATCRLLAGYSGAVALQSFEPATVAWLRRQDPALWRGQISSGLRPHRGRESSLRRFLRRNLLLLGAGRPDFIAYDIDRLPHPAVALARRLGMPVLAWTVASEAQLRKARALADNIIFEHIRP